MKTQVNRTQSRELAFQILYCQHLHDGDMARAVGGVEAMKTMNDLRESIKLLKDSRRATDVVIRSFDQTIEALTEMLKPAKERKFEMPEDGTLDAVMHLSQARKDALRVARETIQLVQTQEALFHPEGFAHRILKTYMKHKDEVANAVEKCLEGWTLRRLISEDSAALRLGATELMYFADIPPKAIINEYIELAKVYGNDDSPGLINAVLDRILRNHPRPEKKEN
ncbi:MAG TPA: transcription antitermination factor NusB [Candidatus Sumerlaeota bacterium]|nr:transcription antitermination factor NusB [Candidatus Sumerlaeota bacterium]HMZ52487.1 transcription antitermination factor NusB [Candidatus Sumerlaeota bacterium]